MISPDVIARFRPLRLRMFAWLFATRAVTFGSIGALVVGLDDPAAPTVAIAPVLLIAGWLMLRLRLIRSRGGLAAVSGASEFLNVPRHAFSLRTRSIRIQSIKSVTETGTGLRKAVVIQTSASSYSYPSAMFEERDAADRIADAVRAKLASLPNGRDLVTAFDARQLLGASFHQPFPVATVAAVSAVIAAFATQSLFLPDDPLALLDAGAGSPLLAWNGEWFRVVTSGLLHENAAQARAHIVVLLATGVSIERLVGPVRTSILLLAVAPLAAAAVAVLAPENVVTLGMLGVGPSAFGLLGAFALIVWRFRNELPTALGLSTRLLPILVVIETVGAWYLLPGGAQLDRLAGGIIGAAIALSFAVQSRSASRLRVATTADRSVFAALCAVWLAALCFGGLHWESRSWRLADRIVLGNQLADPRMTAPDPIVASFVRSIFDIANPPPALTEAVRRIGLRMSLSGPANAEAVSSVHEFLARFDPHEIGILVAAAGKSFDAAKRLGRTLDQTESIGGLVVLGDDRVTVPTIRITSGAVIVTSQKPIPEGARLYAIVRATNATLGLMLIVFPPGFTGQQILPLPSTFGAPVSSLSPEWQAGHYAISPALFDAGPCRCEGTPMGPFFVPLGRANGDLVGAILP